MGNTDYQELALWCLTTQALQSRTLWHRGLGELRVLKVFDDKIQVKAIHGQDNGIPIDLSGEFFLADFEKLLSKHDIEELTLLWVEAERRAEIEAAEQVEKERLRATQLREQELRELEARRLRLLPINDFIELNLRALAVPIRIEIPSPTPASEDFELIKCWMRAEQATRESEERRLLSARLAERAVASFFQDQGFKVEDVSATQLQHTPNPDWRDFDLRINGKPLDVKNARRSRKNPDLYVSYCVPRFKETRHREDVAIAGTLSHWLPLSEMQRNGKSIVFLGISRLSDQERLCAWFGKGRLCINFSENGTGSRSFLPPWMFEYPQHVYQERDNALARLGNLNPPDWTLCMDGKLNPLPACIAAGIGYGGHPNLTKLQSTFIARVMSRMRDSHLSLAVIFLSILEHFLEVLASGAAEKYSPADYVPLLFPTDDRSRPLFIYDPLYTINALLNCLSVLWKERSGRLKDFTVFRLLGFNILHGKRRPTDSQWTTLLAYCGGWVERPTLQPCGRTPLVLGQCETCACGKLICPDCGFCAKGCSMLNDRRPRYSE